MDFSFGENQKKELNYTPLKLPLPEKPAKKKGIKVLILAILAISSLSIYLSTNNVLKTSVNEAKVKGIAENLMKPKATTPDELEEVVEKALEGSEGTYGVAIKNLKTNESYYFNKDRKFQTASLYKVWVMAETYEQIKEGKFSESDMMKQEIPTLNKKFNIASEEAELKEGTAEMSVKEALDKMITISHNYAALLLSDKIRIGNVADFLKNNDLKDSSTGQPPRTTASDMLLFFEKLYNGDLADEEYTEKMLALLKNQKKIEVLPKYLPEEAELAHKTGELNKFAHDAGIVYTDKGDYVIALLSESFDTPGAKDRMAKVSKAVYNYFTN